MSEKSIDVQENDKDVQENDMLLAEVRRLVNPLRFCACTHFVQRIYITLHRTSTEERAHVKNRSLSFIHYGGFSLTLMRMLPEAREPRLFSRSEQWTTNEQGTTNENAGSVKDLISQKYK